jgi:hypothetical protein
MHDVNVCANDIEQMLVYQEMKLKTMNGCIRDISIKILMCQVSEWLGPYTGGLWEILHM